jgi:hypothetical protein
VWDLRYEFPYVPPPADSGFYGPPRAPYVPPGRYLIVLTARGQTQTETVEVRRDPRGASTPEGERQRERINLKAREVSRTYQEAIEATEAIDAVLRSWDASSDSAAKAIISALATQRARARGNSIVSGIGRLFDLTAAIESSSMPPTDTQMRSIDVSVAEFTDIAAKVNDIAEHQLPAARARLGKQAGDAIPRVTPPR